MFDARTMAATSPACRRSLFHQPCPDTAPYILASAQANRPIDFSLPLIFHLANTGLRRATASPRFLFPLHGPELNVEIEQGAQFIFIVEARSWFLEGFSRNRNFLDEAIEQLDQFLIDFSIESCILDDYEMTTSQRRSMSSFHLEN